MPGWSGCWVLRAFGFPFSPDKTKRDSRIAKLGLFCAEVDGVGKFVKSLNVLSWEEACALNPNLNAAVARIAAE